MFLCLIRLDKNSEDSFELPIPWGYF